MYILILFSVTADLDLCWWRSHVSSLLLPPTWGNSDQICTWFSGSCISHKHWKDILWQARVCTDCTVGWTSCASKFNRACIWLYRNIEYSDHQWSGMSCDQACRDQACHVIRHVMWSGNVMWSVYTISWLLVFLHEVAPPFFGWWGLLLAETQWAGGVCMYKHLGLLISTEVAMFPGLPVIQFSTWWEWGHNGAVFFQQLPTISWL